MAHDNFSTTTTQQLFFLEIDLLIGAPFFSDIFLLGHNSGPPDYPIAFETMFGYVVIGNVPVITAHCDPRHMSSDTTGNNFTMHTFLYSFKAFEVGYMLLVTPISPPEGDAELSIFL